MGEIVSFDRSSKIDKVISKLLKVIVKDIYKERKNKDEIEDSLFELDFLERSLYTVMAKLEQNGWKNENTKRKFLDHYSYLFDTYEFNLNFVFQELYLVLITDIYPKILYNENKYIASVINGIDLDIHENHEDINYIKDFLEVLNNQSIVNAVMSDDEKLNDDNIYDIINSFKEGYDISTIVSFFNESEEIEVLDSGIITINRIQNYYLFQTELLFNVINNSVSEEINNIIDYNNYINTFNEIKSINCYPEKYKTIYIDMIIKNINSKKSDIDRLKFARALTEFYFDYKDLLETFEYDTILSIVDLKMNKNDEKMKRGL